ncbi:MAG TPA: 50S ribosomal protein L4 [Ignavibacteria bacterium]|nr:50S ribosomal protein L4 [Bacteroidota bacterium]HRE12213.1 50S ribosomal protein L4 [Ignavibacteria bacterium]HRF66547.1 50S ribosomal protein L4 [Ignavibacteria bacterium]HRJ03724.1 50S ribosomal protein L4 [Ignavibacteria bacterium]HRJ85726.1 50S ribosomal protein L4 [Ignavibacteria bacterium]
MQLNVFKIDGTESKEKIDLPSNVFEIEPNHHLIYQAVRTYLSNQRQGTHKAKERSEVRGGGKKPWKQKGRGTARAGTTRSPVWVGGGTVHGPRPHTYKLEMTKKSAQLARKSALSLKAKNGEIMVVEDINFDKPKTKDFSSILKNLNIDGKKILMLTVQKNDNVYRSGRNIPKVNVLNASSAATYDLVNNQLILIQKSAVDELCKPFLK